MAYQRTGRPPGRPKTKEYVTLMARVPQDVADQAKRYAGLHRHTMSEVLRDGLLMLLQEQDPYRPYVSDTNAAQEIVSDVQSLLEREVQEIVSDTNGVAENVSDMKEAMPALVPENITAQAERTSDSQTVEIVSDSNVDDKDYDPTTHSLGKRCPRYHEYRGTGQSVLRISNRHCRACDREKFHERKQAKRQVQPA